MMFLFATLSNNEMTTYCESYSLAVKPAERVEAFAVLLLLFALAYLFQRAVGGYRSKKNRLWRQQVFYSVVFVALIFTMAGGVAKLALSSTTGVAVGWHSYYELSSWKNAPIVQAITGEQLRKSCTTLNTSVAD